VPSHFTSI